MLAQAYAVLLDRVLLNLLWEPPQFVSRGCGSEVAAAAVQCPPFVVFLMRVF